MNPVDSSASSIRKTVSKLRKTCCLTGRIFVYVFLSGFHSSETIVQYRVKTLETAWKMLTSTRGRKCSFSKQGFQYLEGSFVVAIVISPWTGSTNLQTTFTIHYFILLSFSWSTLRIARFARKLESA